jgi:hypothetical protein
MFNRKLCFAVAVLFFPSTVAAENNPLAPALAGKILCTAPDLTNKTCKDLSRFTKQPNGNYTRDSDGAMSEPINLRLAGHYPTYVKQNMFCYAWDKADMETATIWQNQRVIAGTEKETLINAIDLLAKSYGLKEVCEKLEPANICIKEVLRITSIFEPNPLGDEAPDIEYAIWVTEREGYSLRQDGSDGPALADGCQS